MNRKAIFIFASALLEISIVVFSLALQNKLEKMTEPWITVVLVLASLMIAISIIALIIVSGKKKPKRQVKRKSLGGLKNDS